MVYYFVIAEDGSRYGPADIDTLVQWTREGRVIGSTALVERGTERQLHAAELTAVAAELRRMSGQADVAVERGSGFSNESPTMTQAGRPADVPMAFAPQAMKAAKFPTAPGVPPPPPPAGGPRPHQHASVPYANAGGRFSRQVGSRSKVAAGLLGIFLGGLGMHRFYLGYTGMGLLMLLISFVGGGMTLGYGCGFVWLWGFIEGVVCLCGGMKDADGMELRN
ncbi:MAG: TM2 domain-containing protein [Planctomycetes bacterium]|nr:TM2 domain-containing protein [Planctomycetota bacterium]